MAEGQDEGLKEALSELDDKGWLSLATFADKYDSWECVILWSLKLGE